MPINLSSRLYCQLADIANAMCLQQLPFIVFKSFYEFPISGLVEVRRIEPPRANRVIVVITLVTSQACAPCIFLFIICYPLIVLVCVVGYVASIPYAGIGGTQCAIESYHKSSLKVRASEPPKNVASLVVVGWLRFDE